MKNLPALTIKKVFTLDRVLRTVFPGLLLLIVIFSACQDLSPQPADCDPGFHPCGIDSQDCCLDTTSSNFTWTIDTIGTYFTFLRDVKIVNENNIWVVGLIYAFVQDTSGDSMVKEKFSTAHWNGTEWSLGEAYSSAELHSIRYYREDDIWAISGSPKHWDGNTWSLYHLWNLGVLDENDGGVHYSWGTSSTNMYFVGNKGSIVHFNGSSFTKLNSDMAINLLSVTGTYDGSYVFTCGINNLYESAILEIHDYQVTTLYEGSFWDSEPAGAPRATYVYEDTAYFAGNRGIWKYNYQTQESYFFPSDGNYRAISPHGIHINSPNDIFLCGARSELIHYNGIRWTSDISIWRQFGFSGVATFGMDVKGDMVVLVGYCEGASKGLIAIGRR